MTKRSTLQLPHVIPIPGPVWGRYPLRPTGDRSASPRAWSWRAPMDRARGLVTRCETHAREWRNLDSGQRSIELSQLRARLVREGLVGEALVTALGYAAACAQEQLGQQPRGTQLLAAAVLLDCRMAEMATGEGKTLAIGIAAAVGALAGMPVHVATANDYLAARDAHTLAPMFIALGLCVASLDAEVQKAEDRQLAYGHDVLYTTARELAFDFLRDQHAAAGHNEADFLLADFVGTAPVRVMRGLCFALLDEADSILLDEAEVPLVLSQSKPQAAQRALMWQALSLARKLVEGRDFHVDVLERSVQLTSSGTARLDGLCADLPGPWRGARTRADLVHIALTGLHACQRDVDYVLRDGSVALLDDVTGRIAHGRVWSNGLHTVVALKEGVQPPTETEVIAQVTFQRFFQRYWRLGGVSGTLREAASELRKVYRSPVLEIPPHQASRRLVLPVRRFLDRQQLFEAAAARASCLSSQSRPVLIGTDSVEDSLSVSACLQRLGVTHHVLNALNDAQEANIVALAGRAGSVTVATRMAGRGTDIVLDDDARRAGGLHVLSCQHNASRRADRQLAGRAARQGDPGSFELWICNSFVPDHTNSRTANLVPDVAADVLRRFMQRQEERRRAALRAELMERDIQWEKKLAFSIPAGTVSNG